MLIFSMCIYNLKGQRDYIRFTATDKESKNQIFVGFIHRTISVHTRSVYASPAIATYNIVTFRLCPKLSVGMNN